MGIAGLLVSLFIDLGKTMFSIANIIVDYSIRIFMEINSRLQNPVLSALATLLLASLVFMAVSYATRLFNNIATFAVILLLIALLILIFL